MTENAQILANAAGSPDGGSLVIDVQVTEAVLIDSGSVFAVNLGAERARDVAIMAGTDVMVTNGGVILTSNAGSAGGNIHLDVGRLTLTGDGLILSLGAGLELFERTKAWHNPAGKDELTSITLSSGQNIDSQGRDLRVRADP